MTRSELEIIIKKRAAITVTVFAAVLAINTLLGGSNSSKILSNTIAVNDQWAWYQAKNVRAAIYKTTADLLDGGKLAQYYHSEAQRMRADMEEIESKARALEKERESAKAKSPYFTYAGSLLQIGIVLSTAAILAVAMPLFWGSVAVGTVGAAMFLVAQFWV